ncbi:hypothetical protein JTB14_008391 [Gonioctena quinquepunctata]|nr:hypothetical protein JTB14_008391 [Gonioctena quinquepunctata]
MHQKNANLDPKILVEDSKGQQGHLHGIGDHLHGIGDHLHGMARARDNQVPERMGREEMGPSSGAVPKRRQESRFSASGLSRNEENKRPLN